MVAISQSTDIDAGGHGGSSAWFDGAHDRDANHGRTARGRAPRIRRSRFGLDGDAGRWLDSKRASHWAHRSGACPNFGYTEGRARLGALLPYERTSLRTMPRVR